MTRAIKRAPSPGASGTDSQTPRSLTAAPHTGVDGHPQHAPAARNGGADAYDGWRLELTPGEWRHLDRTLACLTEREREVACAVCAGGANEVVADRLCIALPTLRTHLMRIYQKLGANSKSDLIRHVTAHLLDGYRRGVIESEPEYRSKALQQCELSVEWPARRVSLPDGKSSVSMTTSRPTSGQ